MISKNESDAAVNNFVNPSDLLKSLTQEQFDLVPTVTEEEFQTAYDRCRGDSENGATQFPAIDPKLLFV